MVGDAGNPCGGRQITGQNANRGGLARAVGPQKADDFSLGDSKADVVNRQDGAEILGEMSNLNHYANPVQVSRAAALRSSRRAASLRLSPGPGRMKAHHEPPRPP